MKLAQKIAVNYFRAKLNIIAVVSKKRAARKAFDMFCTPYRKPKKKIARIFDKAEKISLITNDTVVRGYRFNHPQENKLLIIHGFESSIRNFDRYISPFVKKGYEVVGFDAPAHGRSDGKRITLPQYIQMLEVVNKKYGPFNRFLAHSFGGLALAHLLEKIPGEVETKSVLIAPATETTTAIETFLRFLDLNEEVEKEFHKYIYKKSGVAPSYYSVNRALQSVKSSILWFHDEEDELTPLSDALRVKDQGLPNIEFEISKGFGHRKIYRENKVVNRILDFL